MAIKQDRMQRGRSLLHSRRVRVQAERKCLLDQMHELQPAGASAGQVRFSHATASFFLACRSPGPCTWRLAAG